MLGMGIGVGGAGGGSAITPGGVNTNVQYNNNGAFGGSANFTFDGAATVTLSNGSIGTITLGPGNGTASTLKFGVTGASLVGNTASGIGVSSNGNLSAVSYLTSTNCSSSASPAVCGSAASGSVVVAAAATTVVVNTTAVTANSQVQLTFDSSLGTKLSVTCNTTVVQPTVSARTGGTSFTITVPSAPVTNPACFSYTIIN